MVFGGLVIASLGNFGMSKVGLSTSVLTIIIFMSIRYLGLGMVKMPLTDYGLGSVPNYLSGHASSLFNWGKQIASVITTNVLTVLLSINTSRYFTEAGFTGKIEEGTTAYAISAVQAVNDDFLYLAIFLAGSALLSLLMENTGKNKASKSQSKTVNANV
jgi:hypothetical protein